MATASRSDEIRVAVDARRLEGSGIGRYVQVLLRALTLRCAKARFRIIALTKAHDVCAQLGVEAVSYDAPLLSHSDFVRFQGNLDRCSADVFIGPQYYNSPLTTTPTIRVLHDAHPFQSSYSSPDVAVFERLYGRTNLVSLAAEVGVDWPAERSERPATATATLIRAMYMAAVANAQALVTVSRFSAAELSAHIPASSNRWIVIYPCVFMMPGVSRFANAPTILCVSKLEPRKRQIELLEAVRRLNQSRTVVRLWFVGGATASFPEYARSFYSAVAATHDQWLRHDENVPDAWLARAYRSATLLCQPSIHEGFGFPVVEAAFQSTPVAAHSTTAIPEIVGCHGAHWLAADEPLEVSIGQTLDDIARGDTRRPARSRLTRFEPEAFARNWELVIERVLAR